MKKNNIITLTICGIMAATALNAFAAENEPMLTSAAADETVVGTPQISVNGKAIDFSKSNLSQYLFETNGNAMVPVRAVAEEMGFTVGWDSEDKAVTVGDDTWEVRVYIGEDLYSGVTKIKDAVGMTSPQSYGAAPVILDNATFVPAKMFELIGYKYNAVGQFLDFVKIDDNSVQIANPFVPYESVDEAKKVLSFNPSVPSYIPTGYTTDEITVLDNNFLQIIYKNDKGESVCYRTAKGSEDISGDYNTYTNVNKITVGDYTVTVRGNEYISGAVWNDGDVAYSIYADNELSEKEIKDIIMSLK